MNKIDLYEKLVRFLAIKPLEIAGFDIERAKEVIREENKKDISFIPQHGYFEDVMDTVEKRIGNLQPESGILYVYIKGDSSKQRIEKNLLSIILHVSKIYIIGKAEDWTFNDPKIKFVDIEDAFTDNHQRFLIFNSPTYNVALVSRHGLATSGEKVQTEAAITNKKEAVTYLNQVLAPLFYEQQI